MESNLRDLLGTAFVGGASDLFLIEGEIPRLRQDDEIVAAAHAPVRGEDMAAIWRECGLDPERDQDGDASFDMDGLGRLRANAYRSLGRMALALRPIKRRIPDFSALGLPEELLTRWLSRRSGLILFCGPTGAGKSTSVAACLEWINQHQRRHIVTVEDPIEYLFTNQQSFFSQRELGTDTAEFNHALRQVLRQNPDVIFVGEIRDAASALAVLRAAETGHLVISTLHASGVAGVTVALESIARLVSQEIAIAGDLLAQQIIGIMAQQLLPRAGGGRVAILEYLENQAASRKWIANRSYNELRDHVQKGDGEHACPFLRYLLAAAQQGIIEAGVARSACDRPQDFDRAMRGIS